jgi:hypothetical protein
MGFRDKRYGVTWRTKLSLTPTTVWFNTPDKRSNFMKGLISNKIVLRDSIWKHEKNVDEDDI